MKKNLSFAACLFIAMNAGTLFAAHGGLGETHPDYLQTREMELKTAADFATRDANAKLCGALQPGISTQACQNNLAAPTPLLANVTPANNGNFGVQLFAFCAACLALNYHPPTRKAVRRFLSPEPKEKAPALTSPLTAQDPDVSPEE
jgi:hypothetical protein